MIQDSITRLRLLLEKPFIAGIKLQKPKVKIMVTKLRECKNLIMSGIACTFNTSLSYGKVLEVKIGLC